MTADPAVIRRMRHDIGMVFQSFNLFSNMNVLDNITLGPKLLRGLPVDQAEQRAMELLKMVGLADRCRYDQCDQCEHQKNPASDIPSYIEQIFDLSCDLRFHMV